MVELSHIDKSYNMGGNKIIALNDVNLSVGKGEFLSIMGASGSGKSTLMNIIGCMDLMDRGTYFIDDVAVHNCTGSQTAVLRNEKIGFVFQKYHLIQQYSILQNVLMPLLIRGMTRKVAIELAEEGLEMVGLIDRMTHRPNELSGGQQQRAAIARAIVTKPALILADEPTGALDSKTGKEILLLFQMLNENGHTIIQITHDDNVAHFANRMVHLKDGVLRN